MDFLEGKKWQWQKRQLFSTRNMKNCLSQMSNIFKPAFVRESTAKRCIEWKKGTESASTTLTSSGHQQHMCQWWKCKQKKASSFTFLQSSLELYKESSLLGLHFSVCGERLVEKAPFYYNWGHNRTHISVHSGLLKFERSNRNFSLCSSVGSSWFMLILALERQSPYNALKTRRGHKRSSSQSIGKLC